MALNEQDFMRFDFAGTPQASWPALTFSQKPRVGLDLTDYDVGILKGDKGDPLSTLGQPIAQSDIDNYTFRYWFNYFYEEAGPAGVDEKTMAVTLNRLIVRKKFPIPPKKEFETTAKVSDYYALRKPDDAARLAVLTDLLKGGFVCMRRFIGPLQPGLANLPFMEEVIMESGVIPGTKDKVVTQTPLFTRGEGQNLPGEPDKFVREVYWRGETRTPEALLQQATKRAVDIPFLVAQMNLDKPWHPFSRPEIAANIWYRKGKNFDNDYFTAISVALDFKTACCFPLIDERRVYQFPAGTGGAAEFDPWKWKTPDRQKNFVNLGVVRAVGQAKPRVQVVTKNIVYLSTNRGAKVFTRHAQEKISKVGAFPEHGVAEICPEDIYGYLVVYRAFHGLTKGDGFTVFIDTVASSRVRYDSVKKKMERVAAADAGRDMLQYGPIHQKLEQEFGAALGLQPFAVAWAGGGHATRPILISALVEKPPLTSGIAGFLLNGLTKPSGYA
jgi:hypothetical protein